MDKDLLEQRELFGRLETFCNIKSSDIKYSCKIALAKLGCFMVWNSRSIKCCKCSTKFPVADFTVLVSIFKVYFFYLK